MNVDGSTVREIARYGIQLAWSPDAATIAFSLQDDNGLENIAVISADVLTISAGTVISSGNDETPAWRPRSSVGRAHAIGDDRSSAVSPCEALGPRRTRERARTGAVMRAPDTSLTATGGLP